MRTAASAASAVSAARVQRAQQTQYEGLEDSSADQQERPSVPEPTFPSVEEAPVVALSIATNGIHPSTARLIAISVVFYTADRVTEVDSFTRHLNSKEDPGPIHLHGYTAGELAQAYGFNTSASTICAALDGRIIITHDVPTVWGFITHEFRLTQRAANRAKGNRGRAGRGRNRPRAKTILVPQPNQLIDTLATARRQAMPATDTRLRAIAELYGVNNPPETLPELGAVASETRLAMNPDDLLLADARMTSALHAEQQNRAALNPPAAEIAIIDPADLTADQFALQRSSVRVDATKAPHPLVNPGTPARNPDGDWQLVAGMEFVVSPDVEFNPDALIERGVAAGLVYSEKLNRRTSLVVCNENHELRGKAMHAERKNIPLLRDSEFLELLDNVTEGERATEKQPGAAPVVIPMSKPGNANSWNGGGMRHSGPGRRGSGRGGAGNRGKRGGRGHGKNSGSGASSGERKD